MVTYALMCFHNMQYYNGLNVTRYKVKDFDKSTAYGATASLNGDALLAANKQYNRLWTKHYKMPMKLIQSKLQHCSEKIKTTILPTSKNAAEDYCQVVMTVALQVQLRASYYLCTLG